LDYTIIEIYNKYIVVDKILETGDIYINGKILDDFNTRDENYQSSLIVNGTTNNGTDA
jgi:hypothetical protein